MIFGRFLQLICLPHFRTQLYGSGVDFIAFERSSYAFPPWNGIPV